MRLLSEVDLLQQPGRLRPALAGIAHPLHYGDVIQELGAGQLRIHLKLLRQISDHRPDILRLLQRDPMNQRIP
ncbi:hypothetical protein D3C78_1893230 [compost metagenome]